MKENFLQYGERIQMEAGRRLFGSDEPAEGKCIYFLIAGLVKTEFSLGSGSRFTLYLLPDSVFGLMEPLLSCRRQLGAYCMEKSLLYRWDLEGFDLASSVSWELALTAITGLTRMLRILNAEFGERIGLTNGGA